MAPRNLVLKIVLLGDSAVGKTSFVNQYTQHHFQADYQPTLGVNIVVKELTIEELDVNARLVLWDIAGQDKYDLSRRMFFQGCRGALFVYDTTRDATFKNVEKKWLPDLRKFGEKDPAFVLIGNKVDLKDSKSVSVEEGKKLAERISASDFVETSAKHGENVENAFQKLLSNILANSGFKV